MAASVMFAFSLTPVLIWAFENAQKGPAMPHQDWLIVIGPLAGAAVRAGTLAAFGIYESRP